MRFASKRDFLPTLIVWGGTALLMLPAALALFAGNPDGKTILTLLSITGVGLIGWFGLVIYPYFSTSYEITPTHLIIRFGLQCTVIPVKDIHEVTATNKLFRIARNKVWSLDRLLIRYCTGKGRGGLLIAISPQDKAEFVRELQAVGPSLSLVND